MKIFIFFLVLFSSTHLLSQPYDVSNLIKYDRYGNILVSKEKIYDYSKTNNNSYDLLCENLTKLAYFSKDIDIKNFDPYSTTEDNKATILREIKEQLPHIVWTNCLIPVWHIEYDGDNEKVQYIQFWLEYNTKTREHRKRAGILSGRGKRLNFNSLNNNTSFFLNYENLYLRINNIELDKNTARKYDILNNKGVLVIDYITYPIHFPQNYDNNFVINVVVTKVKWIVNGTVLYEDYFE
jgi:hypothetical protein